MQYDVIIIGGGPAGYSAGLYACRAQLKTLVIEKFSYGGQMATAELIENYPGFEEGIDGFDLAIKMEQQARKFGCETVFGEVKKVDLVSKLKVVETSDEKYFAKSVIIASGVEERKLDLPNEISLIGKGVSYCASCDGMFYKDKVVAVIGGGNSAITNAISLSKLAKKVYLVHRRDSFRASKVYLDKLQAENIELIYNSKVVEILAADKVTGLKLVNVINNEEQLIKVDGIFVSIGRIPNSGLYQDQVDMDSQGFIITDENMKTNRELVYAVGDIRVKKLRQVVTAVSDGAIASSEIEQIL